jgi:hypothetical protein
MNEFVLNGLVKRRASCVVARSEVATLLQIAPDLPHARPRRAGQN